MRANIRKAKEDIATLEKILKENFNCEKPLLDDPYFDEEECAPVVFTEEGEDAYSSLICTLYAVGKLTQIDVNSIVDAVDSVTNRIWEIS